MTRIWRHLVFAVAIWLCAGPAHAAVTITFYSHDLRLIDGFQTDFPHGYVMLSGTDASGTAVKRNFGFSALNIFINVLWQPVKGALDEEPLPTHYVAESTPHITLPLSEEKYRAVLAVAEKWRTWPQPSYDIDTHNCVTFVKEMAQAVGLMVSDDKKFIRAPIDFLTDVAQRNAAFIASASNPGVSQQPMPVAATPAAPPAQSLKDRVQQLQDEVANARRN